MDDQRWNVAAIVIGTCLFLSVVTIVIGVIVLFGHAVHVLHPTMYQ